MMQPARGCGGGMRLFVVHKAVEYLKCSPEIQTPSGVPCTWRFLSKSIMQSPTNLCVV